MDLFLATCQGIGLALAAGTVTGAFAGGAASHRSQGGGPAVAVLLIAAVVGGAVLFGLSLSAEDHPAWPGWVVGGLVGLGTFGVVRALVAGAAARTEQGQGSPAAIAGFLTIAALVLAGLSLLISPIALVAFVAVVYLGFARRRHAQQKHEGLRILR